MRDIKVTKDISINYHYINENINKITSNKLYIMGEIDDDNLELHEKLMNMYNFPNVNIVYWTTIYGQWSKKKGINYQEHIAGNTFTNLNTAETLTSLF